MKFILASKSPRRREILSSLGLNFDIITSEADESSPETNPEKLVMTLAQRKGEALAEKLMSECRDITDTLIIACDTLVHFDGNILGKPQDRADAKKMLSMLSGKSHYVSSGLYLYCNGKAVTDVKSTKVWFASLTEDEIERYLDTDEPYDKAGAYAIQGKASVFISGFEGCYFNVVGLPVRKLYEMAKEHFDITLF